jgi:hypothetical protein
LCNPYSGYQKALQNRLITFDWFGKMIGPKWFAISSLSSFALVVFMFMGEAWEIISYPFRMNLFFLKPKIDPNTEYV